MAKGNWKCDCINDFEMGILSCTIFMGPKYNQKGSYMREPRRSKEEVGEVITEAGGWSD